MARIDTWCTRHYPRPDGRTSLGSRKPRACCAGGSYKPRTSSRIPEASYAGSHCMRSASCEASAGSGTYWTHSCASSETSASSEASTTASPATSEASAAPTAAGRRIFLRNLHGGPGVTGFTCRRRASARRRRCSVGGLHMICSREACAYYDSPEARSKHKRSPTALGDPKNV